MLATFLIVFREVIEAGLIVGIVLAAMQGVPNHRRWVAGGIAAGIAGAAILALCASALSGAFSGNGQEIFTACVLGVATLMLGWHNVWMASHGREIATQMKTMGKAVAGGEESMLAMAVVVAIAVLREGSEVVMFLYGVAMSSQEGTSAMLIGGAGGLALGALITWLLYRGLVAIPMKHFFTVTNTMITILAAGMAGQAASVLAHADIIPSLGYELWDSSAILPESSLLGRALHALVGYSDRPVGVQMLVYVLTLVTITLAMRLVNRRMSAPTKEKAHATVTHSH